MKSHLRSRKPAARKEHKVARQVEVLHLLGGTDAHVIRSRFLRFASSVAVSGESNRVICSRADEDGQVQGGGEGLGGWLRGLLGGGVARTRRYLYFAFASTFGELTKSKVTKEGSTRVPSVASCLRRSHISFSHSQLRTCNHLGIVYNKHQFRWNNINQ